MKLTGYTENMTRVFLPLPLSFEFSSSLDTPVDRLDLVFLWESVTAPRFSQLMMENDEGELMFDGIVDEQIYENSKEGKRVTLKCRSRAALLLDNEAKPCTYYRLGQPDLFLNHLAPFGFTSLKSYNSPVQYNFLVPKGYSHWDVLASFCRKCFGRVPSVSPEGVVYTYPNYREKKHLISNGAGEGFRFFHSMIRLKRYGVLSQVYLQDNNGVYSSSVVNEKAYPMNILRTRYHIPPTEMVSYPITSGTRKIKESMQNYFTIQVSLPGLAPIRKGDQVTFRQENTEYKEYLAGDVAMTYNPQSPMTVVTLYDPEYL